MMFSSHIDMIHKNSVFIVTAVRRIRKITVYRVWALQEDTPYMRK